jgi:hypothetical protein
MTARQLNVPWPGNGPAVLTLPQPLTPESLLQLEQALAGVLGQLHHEVCSDATDPGQLEYASWMQQLCPPRH